MSAKKKLIDAGMHTLESDGPQALNARKLAEEIGASTTAVYTHFNGMAGLYEELVRESFIRFGRRLDKLSPSDDPIADLVELGLAYRDFALEAPHRYRFMFSFELPDAGRLVIHDLTQDPTPTEMPEANATFAALKAATGRAIAAGRLRAGDALAVAGQLWTGIHGFVTLEMSGIFGPPEHAVFGVLAPMTVNLLVGLGAVRSDVEASLGSVVGKISLTPRPTPQAAVVRPGRRTRT